MNDVFVLTENAQAALVQDTDFNYNDHSAVNAINRAIKEMNDGFIQKIKPTKIRNKIFKNNFTAGDLSFDMNRFDEDITYIMTDSMVKYFMLRSMFYCKTDSQYYIKRDDCFESFGQEQFQLYLRVKI